MRLPPVTKERVLSYFKGVFISFSHAFNLSVVELALFITFSFFNFILGSGFTSQKVASSSKLYISRVKRTANNRFMSLYTRQYSQSSKPGFSPEKIYLNADKDKSQILRESTGKSGVYR